jgi:hypothetical protein
VFKEVVQMSQEKIYLAEGVPKATEQPLLLRAAPLYMVMPRRR